MPSNKIFLTEISEITPTRHLKFITTKFFTFVEVEKSQTILLLMKVYNPLFRPINLFKVHNKVAFRLHTFTYFSRCRDFFFNFSSWIICEGKLIKSVKVTWLNIMELCVVLHWIENLIFAVLNLTFD